MAYISARTGLFLGLENLDTTITIVCSEISFGWSTCRVETRLVCIAGWLVGFCVMRSFAEGNFRMDYNVCPEMPFSEGSCHVESSPLAYLVNRLTCFCMVWVFT